MSGMGAVFEIDIKKIIALSTLRQLGLMIIVLSAGIKELAFFHLITHAIFKSTLFMCAGFIIHRVGGFQDSRYIRGFSLSRPVLGVFLRGTNLALCGFPFLAGFYSKDARLEFMFRSRENFFLVFMVVIGTGLTVAYRFRVLYLRSLAVRSSKIVREVRDVDRVFLKRVRALFRGTIVRGFLIY